MAKRERISLIDNRAVIERLLSLTGTKTNRALAKRLDVTPTHHLQLDSQRPHRLRLNI